ncbi:hypothetical protein BKA70DRAFT_1369330 [Coprinopsis sp. MPI-PUGE-AT-0042]|nr:hypothetical protein BKA70DRAFT_1369330 [Coprinopsis sp. MPI-PUGE-AT-0042]
MAQPTPLSISTLIANDAPLLSPTSMSTEAPWESDQTVPLSYSYYNLQATALNPLPSCADPSMASKVLKSRLSPASSDEPESLCFPTHQVFELSEPTGFRASTAELESAPLVHPQVEEILSASSTAEKRSASPAAGPSAKKRATMATKEFIPPDVSGLSKREARLVKNRAAAFLSRQRKREEFENMEVRVAELEQENARLLALAESGGQPPRQESSLASEVEILRAQLAAAEKREKELSEKLNSRVNGEDVSVKVESMDAFIPTAPSSSRSSPASCSNKSSASFGLMVLLCALPSLLSMPMQSASRFSVASPFSSLSSTYKPTLDDFDWSSLKFPDTSMDLDDQTFPPSAALPRKLEFADVDTSELGDLGGLDISFDTSSTDNGKIRVRIHPSSATSSRATSPGASSTSSSKAGSPSPMDSWADARSSFSSHANSPMLSSTADPFLGMDYGSFNDLSYRMNDDDDALSELGLGSECFVPDNAGGKRRVRIALKTPPSSDSEGGEWEVQIC